MIAKIARGVHRIPATICFALIAVLAGVSTTAWGDDKPKSNDDNFQWSHAISGPSDFPIADAICGGADGANNPPNPLVIITHARDNIPLLVADAAPPATQPADSIDQLIRNLGDDDFHVRMEASRKLKAMGTAAIPALAEAKKSPDPQIHASAEELIADIDHPPVATSPLPQATGVSPRSTSTTFMNGVKSVEMNEPGRITRIEEDAHGLKMTVTGEIDGQQVTREYKAENAEQLRKQNREAYALYQQGAGAISFNAVQARGNFNVNVNVNVGPGAFANARPRFRIIPFLGILVAEEAQAGKGLPIVQVIPSSMAAKMGLKEGDVVTKLNGKEVHTTLALRQIFPGLGRTVAVELMRQGKPLKLSNDPKPETPDGQ